MLDVKIEPGGAVLERYMLSAADVCLIQGHRASIKSTNTCDKLLMNAAQQPFVTPDVAQAKGLRTDIRYRRTVIVRGTYDELKRTTIKTWLGKFPEDKWGRFRWDKPPVHHIKVEDLDWEVIFLALDREEDLKKLTSFEASDAWWNEFREGPRKIIEDLGAVVGRFPDAFNPYRPQINGDTNAAPAHHWFSIMSGQAPMPDGLSEEERAQLVLPRGWEIFLQPPAMFEVLGDGNEVVEYRHNPEREGRRFVADAFFDRIIRGRPRSWIRVHVLNKPSMEIDGDAVWPRYREDVHKAKTALAPLEGHVIMVGLDFGRTPAAVFGQRVFGRWRILRELCAFGVSAKTFAPLVKQALAEWFPGYAFILYGDPSGENLAEADDISPYLMFQSEGLTVLPAPTNDPTIRIAAVEGLLDKAPEGVPLFQVSPNCVRINAAMAGDYHYQRVQGTGREQTKPLKNPASHVADALQYLVLGAGEGSAMLQPAMPSFRPKPPERTRGWTRLRAFAGR